MLNTREVCGCARCYTLTKSAPEKRLLPSIMQTGAIGRQTRTAYAYFETAREGGVGLCDAMLRIFVQCVRLCGKRVTVYIKPVLPCGAPMEVREYASFDVARGFCGWITVDILPLMTAAQRELGSAPFGLALSVNMPALITFSAEPPACPRLMLDWHETPVNSETSPVCPCAGAVDICAPAVCGCCPGSSGIRVESQVWDIEFEREDTSVVRRVDRIREGTFFVTNCGADALLVTVETGFDASRWAHDTQKSITPGETQAIVARFYGKQYRLVLSVPGAGRALVEYIGQYYF